MVEYELTFTTVHSLTQDDWRNLWAAGDWFSASVHSGARTYAFGGRVAGDDIGAALTRGIEILHQTINTPVTIVAAKAEVMDR